MGLEKEVICLFVISSPLFVLLFFFKVQKTSCFNPFCLLSPLVTDVDRRRGDGSLVEAIISGTEASVCLSAPPC